MSGVFLVEFWNCLGLMTPFFNLFSLLKGECVLLLSYACPTTIFGADNILFQVPTGGKGFCPRMDHVQSVTST